MIYPELKGKIMILCGTGGKGGMGFGVTEVMAKNGVAIEALDINETQLAETVKIVEQEHGKVIPIKVDVRNFGECQQAVKKVIDEFGKVDILVNIAAVGDPKFTKWHETDEELFDRIVGVNIKGLFNMCKAVVPYMVKQKSGKIINFSSMWSKSIQPGAITYSSSKAFVNAVTVGLALELGEFNINVNAICPGMVVHPDPNLRTIATPHLELIAKRMNVTLGEAIRRSEQNIPLKRRQEPLEFGEMVAYLSSENAKNITGQVISIDGGMGFPQTRIPPSQ